MTLHLYFHPLSSYCHKALIALYERNVAFTPELVDLGDAASRAHFTSLWPLAKMPVLRDEARGCTIAESTVVIDYLDAFYPGAPLTPTEPDAAWRTRLWDRFFDNYLQTPMQKVVSDRFRPEGGGDAFGVAQAIADIGRAYDILDHELGTNTWAIGDAFTLADCAAVPALIYADAVAPLPAHAHNVAAYLDRLLARPSVVRTLREAEPYFPMFPLDRKPRIHAPRASSAT